ncbi:MAG: redoxin domain-containing protein [Candidatus Pseudobacter hemicellulosilyticus]|uniref:Redoxin domain-containing protein n=1 Tax=Candidatus Pseudobacter hemicellulosilyticus TaxID=3121375 RepID=A0AAJ5WTQ1_9BACT|nr:MAG: redoxin domain-containing protein [Pseudobacter sp.]
MKKWFLFLAASFCLQFSFAQAPTPSERKKLFPTLQLLQVDSTTLTSGLLKRQPTVIMYFSPSCDHCQHQMDDMLAHTKEMKNIQVVLATYQPFDEMVEFHKKYHIEKHSNYKLGRDVNFILPPFYDIRNLPFIALYSKEGKLLLSHEGNIKVEKLLQALK